MGMTMLPPTRRQVLVAAAGACAAISLSCKDSSSTGSGKDVVLYTSIDEPVVKPIVEAFEKKTGIKVRLKTDTEASKTSGLVALLRAEKANPQSDVFWNNEPFHTINLAEEGVLTAYDSPAAKDILPQYKDAKGRWASSGLRFRMIAFAPSVTGVTKIEDLVADPNRFGKGKICMGFPALGTIAGHLAALRLLWGAEKYEKFLKALDTAEVKLLGGNSEVVKQIALGNTLVGLTDNDDLQAITRELGPGKVMGISARTAEGGALAMPSTLGLVTGAKHDADAKKLIDYLLTPEVEQQLISAHYAARIVRLEPTTRPPEPVMQIDYEEAAKGMKEAVDKAREILEGKK